MDETSPYYPVFVSLTHRLAVVVGGGGAAERKVRSLRKHGADVLVVAAELAPGLEQMESSADITVEHRGYVRGDLEGAAIAFCFTAESETQRAVFEEAQDRGCLVNVSGRPDLCDFIAPSVVTRGRFQLAVSTGGAAPGVAKRVRRVLAEEYGDEWGEAVELIGEARTLVNERVSDPAERKRMLEAMADGDLPSRLAAGAVLTADSLCVEFSMRTAETEDAETKDAETKDAETGDAETKDAETKDDETKDDETKDDETKDAETRDAE